MMKYLRKALTLLLAFAMILSFGMTAFATGTESYTITITNDPEKTNVSIKGSEYKAYKLFDVTYAGMPDAAATDAPHNYTVNQNFSAFSYDFEDGNGAVTGDALVKGVAGLQADSAKLNRFAEAVYVYAQKQGIVPKASGTAQGESLTLDCTKAGPGYYLVYGGAKDSQSQSGITSALILDTTNPNAAVAPKVEAPKLDKKVVGEDGKPSASTSAQVGDSLTFTLTSKVPDMRGYDTYTMKFSDTMSQGLTLAPDSFTVTIGRSTLPADQYTVSTDVVGKTFQLTIPNLVGQGKGETITVTYRAALNEKALDHQNESNRAVLEYSNDPTQESEFGKTPEKKVEIYDFGINVLKFAFNESEGGSQSMSKKLAGAKFVLKNAKDATAKYYKWNPAGKTESGKVTWEANRKNGTTLNTNGDGVLVTMDTDGNPTNQKASFNGLKTGTYYLEEIQAPDGYNKLAEPIQVTITTDKNTGGKVTKVVYTFTIGKDTQTQEIPVCKDGDVSIAASANVANKTGTELPSTGGIGTTIFYVAGGMLMLTAAVLLITKKRMAAKD